MTGAEEPDAMQTPPAPRGWRRVWPTMVAAAKVGATIFWGLPPTRVVLPAVAPEHPPHGEVRETPAEGSGRHAVQD